MIVNLTQHPATSEQAADGVVDLPQAARDTLGALLTFAERPTPESVVERAQALAALASAHCGEDRMVMIGGAPYLMAPLESALRRAGLEPLYAFSIRVSREEVREGRVVKTNIFCHAGWVPACPSPTVD